MRKTLSQILVLGLTLVLPVLGAGRAEASSGEMPYRMGPAAAALGGAGRAASDPSETGWLNPAALVHTTQYHIAFSHQQSNRNSGDGYRDYALMLADGGEEKIATGSLAFVQRSTLRGGAVASGGGQDARQKDIQASVGFFIPSQRISVGFTYRRLIHEQYANDITQDTFTVGTLLPVGESFGFALVGHNLAGSSGSAPIEAQWTPSVALGVHASYSILQLRADVVRPIRDNSQGRNDVHAGLESWFRNDFAFRFGTKWLESRDETWATVGIGFKGPKLSFGYAFEKETRTSDGTRHTFDMWLPL